MSSRGIELTAADATAAHAPTAGLRGVLAPPAVALATLLAALIAQLLGLRRFVRVSLWTFLVLTTLATIYFGWHYIVDDIAGAAIGIAAVVLGAKATGHELRPARARRVVVAGRKGAAEAA